MIVRDRNDNCKFLCVPVHVVENITEDENCENGGRAHYVMVSRIQWKPFWLTAQLYPQNDWLGGKKV